VASWCVKIRFSQPKHTTWRCMWVPTIEYIYIFISTTLYLANCSLQISFSRSYRLMALICMMMGASAFNQFLHGKCLFRSWWKNDFQLFSKQCLFSGICGFAWAEAPIQPFVGESNKGANRRVFIYISTIIAIQRDIIRLWLDYFVWFHAQKNINKKHWTNIGKHNNSSNNKNVYCLV